MLKSKISGTVQEVVLPDFPDDDNTVTTTVTKSRRVSFGTNFVKEFIVGSAVSAQCMSEYEQAFPSSDSSNADSSHSAAEIGILDQSKFAVPESLKVHKLASTIGQSVEPEFVENHPKPSKFSRTICFSADSPTADMEFTEGCITLAKSILDKKNKEMTVIIQAIPKETKKEEKPKEEETKYFDASQFEMSITKCLKSKENKREEKRFESEKTKIFSKFEDEMSITRCNKIFNDDESDSSWANCKENLMPLDVIMRHLDKDNSDLENDLFNPKKSFNNFLNSNPLDCSNDSEKLNLNESMDISTEFHPNVFKETQKTTLPDDKLESKSTGLDLSEKIIANDSMEISGDFQTNLSKVEESPRFFEKPNTDESEKIYTDLQPDTQETSQNSIKSDEAIDFATKDKSEDPEKNFPNEGFNEFESCTHSNMQPNVSEAFEILPPTEQVISDKTTELSNSEKLNTSMKYDTDCQPLSDEKIVPEVELDHCEHLNKNEAMDISIAEAVAESPLLDERIINEAQLNDLEKLNSENVMEITADNRSKSFETIENPENPSLTEAVEVEDSDEPRVNEPIKILTDIEAHVSEIQEDSPPDNRKSVELNSTNETEETTTWNREPSLVDIKTIESLKEQSKEPGCIWSLKDLRYPLAKTLGLLSFTCELLESATIIYFYLKTSNDDRLDSCSIIANSEIGLNEEKHYRLSEYELVIGFGFQELKKFFDERRHKVETIRHIPYFLDQINSFLFKTNSYLRQIHSILTFYPGSRLKGSTISFRLYSFPIFFSCVVSVDLTDLFRLSTSSLSFEYDFGALDENKIGEIFQKCLKNENSLCEFVVQSTKYLFDLEKKSGYVSKRQHIRLLPVELKL